MTVKPGQMLADAGTDRQTDQLNATDDPAERDRPLKTRKTARPARLALVPKSQLHPDCQGD
jgi:hypothetical protein